MSLLGPMIRSRELSRIMDGLAATTEDGPPLVRVGGLWGSSCAYLVAGIGRRIRRGALRDPNSAVRPGLLVVTANIESADEFASDFRLFSDAPMLPFPAWDTLPAEGELVNHEVFGDRLGVLSRLLFRKEAAEAAGEAGATGPAGGAAPARPAKPLAASDEEDDGPEPDGDRGEVIVAPIQALLQPVVTPRALVASSLEFRHNEQMAPEELAELLIDQGFEHEEVAELPGTFATRGGLVDVFPYGTTRPLRVEFFGDRVESIREYDPGTQRSLRAINHARILAIGSDAYQHVVVTQDVPTFLSYVPEAWPILFVEPHEVQERAERAGASGDAKRLFPWGKVHAACRRHPMIHAQGLALEQGAWNVNFSTTATEQFSGQVSLVSEELTQYVEAADTVHVFCNNDAEETRLKELIEGTAMENAPELLFWIGHLCHGFDFGTGRTTFLAHHEIFHRYAQHRQIRRRVRTEPIESFVDLNKNDHVVHITHGIARYRGLIQLEKAGELQEFLDLEFADHVRLYVPVTKVDLVQKYVGGGASPTLSKLGGDQWIKRKAAAKEAVKDLALSLLEVQAAREKVPGTAYPPDDHLMREFEESFIYPETDDQLTAMGDIRGDLESPRPMDRLLCGDVGYGKTELAMRAAFKVVEAGKQVGVLVPTTILCQQHYRTFSERMADYPVVIDYVSRFKSKGEQAKTLQAVKDGAVDILIGTHRLLSADVEFKDIGLVIVDEEQRFGVAHKERLKRLRYTVDVLTMTATPIPRTLHMSLLGIKDISALMTPPQDRISIQTEVCRFDKRRVREAILRELNRDGQVFFVHNRVYDINQVAHRLATIVPEARMIVAHGQMSEHQLEQRMSDFVEGKADVLVSTSIIESGLDIPNANTIFIHEADMFGLADLHQLRGRVGRYKHRAYSYVMMPEKRPITRTAMKRLKAIEEYSDLGAGFRLAMRDLEIRGAGNILGPEQSGHIAAVGYDLYCRLLDQAVRELRDEEIQEHSEIDIDLQLDSYIPNRYIRSDVLKMAAYRRLARARTLEEVADAHTELEDRFGTPPLEVQNLVAKHRLRVQLEPLRFTYFGLRGDHVLLKFDSPEAARGLAGRAGESDRLRVLNRTTGHLLLPARVRDPLSVVDFAERIFGPQPRDDEGREAAR
jgi:transcription-repair coupling factor (superfamily II helicase)